MYSLIAIATLWRFERWLSDHYSCRQQIQVAILLGILMGLNTRFARVAVFLMIACGAFLLLHWLGHGEQAWEKLKDDIASQLYAALSLALAAIVSLLTPTSRNQPVPSPPLDPPNSSAASKSPANSVEPPVINALLVKINDWQIWGEKAKSYVRAIESNLAIMDTRQALLRLTVLALVFLSLFVCICGFVSLRYLGHAQGQLPLPATVFIQHLCHLLIPYTVTGSIIGAVVFRIRAKTDCWDSLRTGLVVGGTVGLVSLLMALPYVFSRMWAQDVTWLGVTMPMLWWMLAFRIIAAPVGCAVASFCGFYAAKTFSRR